MPTHGCLPRELSKAVLPTYTIEPPDILVIDATHMVPRHPYHLKTLDILGITVVGTLPDQPITGPFSIESGGLVNLGPPYGTVKVAGMTVDEARIAVEDHLRQNFLKSPQVTVSLLQMSGSQQIAGEHLVGPDGTVTLGSFGSVSVVGHTLASAKMAIEWHLSQFLENPEVSVDVYAYNSKVYYIVTQGAGLGDGVHRFPITGNETVLDAISNVNGLTGVSSKRIWIARPSTQPGNVQILPVKWEAITAQAAAETNYQILPGDRVFIAEDKLIAFDTTLGKIISPLERVMGFALLGTGVATRLSGPVLKGGGNRQNNF
ncbi:MAG TPA: polysaccharide biosynthesis/export family protein [Thermoguttaceae bacterium]|nr:polysaccharide biosynthesis/export family protein [Thermoguttaceae bacterium]